MSKLSFHLLLALCLGACSFSQSKGHYCSEDRECSPGSCHNGLCIDEPPAAANGGKAGRSAPGTGNSETPGEEGGSGATGTTTSPATGQSGSGGSSTKPATGGSSGARDAGTDAGPSTPPPATGACKSTDAPRSCTYSVGCMGTQRCVGAAWGTCDPPADRMGMAETCNGLDDNCNGMVDDLPPAKCYPSGTVGCTAGADGTFSCTGHCSAGTQLCTGGELKCNGAVTPEPEMCQASGTTQLDENCNGVADEMCECTAMTTCYTGGGSPGVGECRQGTRACVNGMYANECVGEVKSTPEVCNGKDDDCNGMTDDVLGVGQRCMVPLAMGECAMGTNQCVAGNAAVQCVSSVKAAAESCNGKDDNCDGPVDNVPGPGLSGDKCPACALAACAGATTCFDLQTDAKNCGMCANACPTGNTCVAGMCKAPTTGGAGGGATGGAGGTTGGTGGSMTTGGAAGGVTAGAGGA